MCRVVLYVQQGGDIMDILAGEVTSAKYKTRDAQMKKGAGALPVWLKTI